MIAEATTPLTTLLGYAARGWPLLPIHGLRNGACMCPAGKKCKQSPGKHPLTPHGFKDASTGPAAIREWFTKHPGCNWALRTGEALPEGGYLVVLDIDPRNQGDESLQRLEREHGDLPNTIVQISGGNGQHYFLASSEPMASAVLAEGIEFKAQGGYVLVHPSSHLSGRRYEWDVGHHPDDTPIAKLPAWVPETLASNGRGRPSTTGDDAANTILGEAFRIAGMLRELLPEGRRMVVCPWADEHTDTRGTGTDSSTVLLPPTPQSVFGGFKCLHSHCQKKGWKEVFKALPPHAVDGGRKKFAVRPAPPPTEPVSGVMPVAAVQPVDWKQTLIYKRTKTGGATLEKISANVITILRHDPRWAGKIRYDEFAEAIRVTDPPWDPDDAPSNHSNEWRDEDDVRLQAWLMRQNQYALDVSIGAITQSVSVVAHANSYHDVRDYLNTVEWDGVARIEEFFPVYFGAESTTYTRAVGARWLISLVARVFEPGCQVDCAPVLEGRQGGGKSTALEALVGPSWFSDSQLAIGDADGYAALRGKWLIELAELDALRGRSVTAVKQYISARSDHYRSSYGRRHQTHPRQCGFAGTTNEDEYFTDTTGNRRFWPIACGVVNVDRIREDRDQIWAEAVSHYRDGRPWHVDTAELRKLCTKEQEARMHAEPWEEPIAQWLKKIDARAGVTTYQVLVGALQVEPGRVERSSEMRAAKVLRALGFARGKPQREGKDIIRKYFPPVAGE